MYIYIYVYTYICIHIYIYIYIHTHIHMYRWRWRHTWVSDPDLDEFMRTPALWIPRGSAYLRPVCYSLNFTEGTISTLNLRSCRHARRSRAPVAGRQRLAVQRDSAGFCGRLTMPHGRFSHQGPACLWV